MRNLSDSVNPQGSVKTEEVAMRHRNKFIHHGKFLAA